MSLADTSAALLTARRALNTAESAHAEAIAAEVRASVPGPWVALPEVGAVVEQGPVLVGLDWLDGGWRAWAAAHDPSQWHKGTLTLSATPRDALSALRGRLVACPSTNGRAALALVVRLLRGWAPSSSGDNR